jgi:hypothetical protein
MLIVAGLWAGKVGWSKVFELVFKSFSVAAMLNSPIVEHKISRIKGGRSIKLLVIGDRS